MKRIVRRSYPSPPFTTLRTTIRKANSSIDHAGAGLQLARSEVEHTSRTATSFVKSRGCRTAALVARSTPRARTSEEVPPRSIGRMRLVHSVRPLKLIREHSSHGVPAQEPSISLHGFRLRRRRAPATDRLSSRVSPVSHALGPKPFQRDWVRRTTMLH